MPVYPRPDSGTGPGSHYSANRLRRRGSGPFRDAEFADGIPKRITCATIRPNGRHVYAVSHTGEQTVSDDKTNETKKSADAGADRQEQSSSRNGPKFTEAPDPLGGLKKSASDVMASMEGKTVSMKTYVGTIIAVIVLMLLARCGT